MKNNDKAAKKPFEEPKIGPASDLEQGRKDYPIMGFVGPGSGPIPDGLDGTDGVVSDGTDAGPADSLGDSAVPDGIGAD